MDQKYKEKYLNDFMQMDGGTLEKYLHPTVKLNKNIYFKTVEYIETFKEKQDRIYNPKYGVELLKVKNEPPLFLITDFNVPYNVPIYGYIGSIASYLMMKYISSQYIPFDGVYPSPKLITFLMAKPLKDEFGNVVNNFNCIELAFQGCDVLVLNQYMVTYGFFKPEAHYLEEEYFKEIIVEWQKN